MRDLINYTHNYIDHLFEEHQARYRKKKIMELITDYKHDSILEIGCGMAPFFLEFRSFRNLIIVEPALHFYENAIKLLRNYHQAKSNIVIINNTLEGSAPDLSQYKFDYILLSSLLHELENASAILEDIHKLSNTNTVIHVNVPNANSFHRLLALEMGIISSAFELSRANIQLEQHSVFDLSKLSELILANNFQIIRSGSYFIKPFTHNQMSHLLDAKIIDEKVLDGLYQMIKYMPDLGSEIFIECKINS